MSRIKEKSEENMEAAQLLINNRKYTSSVHCSYYGSFQLMKHILATKCNFGYDEQNTIQGGDSHSLIRDRILNEIRKPVNKKDIKNLFNSIKADRKNADYYQKKFNDCESLDTLDQSKKLISLLKREFVI